MSVAYDPRLFIPGYSAPPTPGLYHINIGGSATAAQLGNSSSAINTTGKAVGVKVWDSTNNRVMIAQGALPGEIWSAADGSGDIDPFVPFASITFSAVGTLAIVRYATKVKAVSFSAVATLSISTTGTTDTAVAFAATGSLSAVWLVTRGRAVAFNGVGSLAVAATVRKDRAVAFNGAGVLGATSNTLLNRAVAFSASGTLSAVYPSGGFSSGFSSGFGAPRINVSFSSGLSDGFN